MRISDWSSDVCSSDLLRGGRDGAEVEDGGEPPFGPAQELRQLLRRDHVLDLVVGEVAPLVALAQAVADDHRLAALAEGGDEIGADEAGAAGDEKHGRGESLGIWRSVKKRLLIEDRPIGRAHVRTPVTNAP